MKDADKHASIQLIPLKMGVLLSLLALISLFTSTLFCVSLDATDGHLEQQLTVGRLDCTKRSRGSLQGLVLRLSGAVDVAASPSLRSLVAGMALVFFPLLNYVGIELMQDPQGWCS